MSKLKKLTFLCLMLVMLVPMVAQASDYAIKAKSAVLMDAQSGQILFSQRPSLELPPASITKTMTLLLTMEAVDSGAVDLKDQVEITPLAESMGGSQLWLSTGEIFSLKGLIKAILIPSANDAAVAVAQYIGGTEQNFVQMMNQKAKQLGLKNTHFMNPTGLPVAGGGHYSSARDIAVMVRELITNHSQILKWSDNRVDKIKNGTLPLYTTNDLIGHYPGADGLKTGWTPEAGYCLVGTAKRNGRRLITVVMGTDSEEARVDETADLLNYGFRAFHKVRLINSKVKIKKLPVNQGKELTVTVETANKLSVIIKKGSKNQIKRKIEISKNLQAPVKKGQVVGRLVFLQQDKELGTVNLVTTKEIKQASWFVLVLRWLQDFVLGFLK
ncbi:D-alanyl-D-alanine carboxypeptidase [Halobacteroides halobius DSM 5150]|uniref:serine-type D-Ala-D-Ala carboxypeptidase n=1 Tax=Halobacteroides halobius (strain ATCC 35273 / DSM 5150 / MD-1) TaxID=748449 RepID=L0K4C2_HALHC|nr:D-alanyl-D-alanine carboxypeptidase family protein [Halobacteroides halobius]AGB40127.1 D-alanyl-D-alanine carboxypeptidase [Halobacteroides halobius DSM 5150]